MAGLGLALFWADRALDDLMAIRAGLEPAAAARIGRLVADAADCLVDFPERGQDEGPVRALPLPGLPWRLLYRVNGAAITVLRVASPPRP